MSVATVPPGQQLEVLSVVWPYATSLTLVYVVTLSIFPGFISELKDASLGTWYPHPPHGLLQRLRFHRQDDSGAFRSLENVLRPLRVRPRPVPLLPSLLQACALGTPTTPLAASVLPPFPHSSPRALKRPPHRASLMRAAPAVVSEVQAEATGTIMVLFLVIGLALGSIV